MGVTSRARYSVLTMSSSTQTSGELNHRQIMTVMAGLMTGMLLAALDQTIVSTALPVIVQDLKGLDHYSWVVTAYLLTSTASAPLYGKISDLYGRRPVFQFAIVVFLVGSALAGLSRNMGELIATRALQGVGAGGLMALVFAIIGDVVPPRQRSTYQGYFGGVWGLASVAGPLLGGLFTEHLSWRWVFYVNLPFGAAALAVTSVVLRAPHIRRNHIIDYLGAGLLVTAVTAVLLAVSWSGPDATSYGWTHPVTVGLLALGVASTAAFLRAESRAAEPIVPLRLFANRVFSIVNGVGFLIGAAMFGTIVYLPLYLQIVKGATPTAAGLLLLPLMIGVLSTAISSGRAITRTGRYKIFPVAGTGIIAVGMTLLTRLQIDTPLWQVGAAMMVVGAGLGLVMQVLVVIAQNAVDVRDLGVATSAVTFFRSVGGTLGTAALGAVFTSRLAGASGKLDLATLRASGVGKLPRPILDQFISALHAVFAVGIPVALFAFTLSWGIRELPLRGPSGTSSDRETEIAV
jgi:EmrB/QacA subfamily drug resistance transporter